MKPALSTLLFCLLTTSLAFAQTPSTNPPTPQPAATPTTQPSPTFTDILSRVAERHPETQAILRVNLRPDAPDYSPGQSDNNLRFSIRHALYSDTNYEITIYPDGYKGYADFESYLLKPEPRIQQEKERLDAYLTQLASRQKAAGEANIAKFGQGKLKYGMTSAEVYKILGPSQGGASRPPRGYTEYVYPLCNCIFNNESLLVDAREHSKLEIITQPAAHPATQPANAPAEPSATFTDILSRVAERDPDTQAILHMNLRPDAPAPSRPNEKFILTINKSRGENDYYVRIYPAGYLAFTDYESYILKPDPRIELEVKRLGAYEHKLYLKAKAAGEANIAKFGQGKLKYGMSIADVEKITGPSQGYNLWQAGGYTENIYTLCNCIFYCDLLVNARERGKPEFATPPATQPAKP